MTAEQWQITAPQVITIDDPVTRLEVSMVAGRIDVVAGDEAATRVEVTHVTGRPFELRLDNGVLRLHYPSFKDGGLGASLQWLMGRASADISIAVPRGAALELGTVSGELFVSGAENSLRASTVSGDLIVDGASGVVRARTVSGNVVARSLAGTCDMSTVSGSVTASGAIEQVRFDAVSGDVTLDTSVPDVDVTAKTVSGNVTVRRPAGAPVFSTISALTGKQVIDQRGGAQDGFFRLAVTTTSGHVTVVDSVPAPAPAPEAAARPDVAAGAAGDAPAGGAS